jgi:hypothetical protein
MTSRRITTGFPLAEAFIATSPDVDHVFEKIEQPPMTRTRIARKRIVMSRLNTLGKALWKSVENVIGLKRSMRLEVS